MRAHQTYIASGEQTTSAQPLLLSILCLCLLPQAVLIATALTILKWLQTALFRQHIQNAPGRKRILVTGGNTASILGMARALEAAGHEVYVIDHERAPYSSPLRSSNAIAKFVGLPAGRLGSSLAVIKTRFFHLGSIINVSFDISQKQPLTNLLATILQLIETEKIKLWISIQEDGLQTVLQTKEIVTKHSSCQIYGPDSEVTRLSKDQDQFFLHVERLEHDIQCPSRVMVRSRAEIHRILLSIKRTDQKYILEKKNSPLKLPLLPPAPGKIELVPNSTAYERPTDQRYTLPQSSLNETYSSVAALTISREQPWLMHQLVEGRPVNVSALVINNTVSTFTASMSTQTIAFSSIQMSKGSRGLAPAWRNREIWQHSDNTRPLDPKSATAQMLLDFTERFCRQLPTSTNAQLNLRFILAESATSGGIVQKFWATGCDFEISPLLIQQALTSGQLKFVGAGYGCALNGGPTLLSASSMFEDRDILATYSLPAAVYQNLFLPIITVMLFQAWPTAILTGVAVFLNQIAFGREELFDGKDPFPWVWQWFVQLPFEAATHLGEYTIDMLVNYIKQSKRKRH